MEPLTGIGLFVVVRSRLSAREVAVKFSPVVGVTENPCFGPEAPNKICRQGEQPAIGGAAKAGPGKVLSGDVLPHDKDT
jgi:hypothetical protein